MAMPEFPRNPRLPIPADLRDRLLNLDENRITLYERSRCPHCQAMHDSYCGRVKRLVFHGTEIAEVEFWADGEWDDSNVIYPSQVYYEDDQEMPNSIAVVPYTG